MFKWRKIGRIFNPSEISNKPWMKEFAQCTSALIFDDFVRIYFSCRPEKDEANLYVSYTTYADFKREDLTQLIGVAERPVLELGELGAFDEFGIYPTCTIRINNVIYLYYAGWTRMQSIPVDVAIGVATSNDGVNFKKLGKGPIISKTLYEPFQFSGPKVREFSGNFYMFYLAGEAWVKHNGRSETIYKIRLATSSDGINWKRDGKNLLSSILGDDECQAGPDVFFYGDRYHMYFSYRYGLDFRGNDRGYRIGYAYSHDLFNWTRDDENVGIGLSEEGWDSTDMHYPHIFELDGKMYMLYNGNEFGKYGFGLAELI